MGERQSRPPSRATARAESRPVQHRFDDVHHGASHTGVTLEKGVKLRSARMTAACSSPDRQDCCSRRRRPSVRAQVALELLRSFV